MTRYRLKTLFILAFAAFGATQTASADSTNADCQVREKGNNLYQESGDCYYSQRQGNVSIRLKNGEEYNLRPGKNAGKYKDQKNRDVKRKVEGDKHVYDWNHRHITVSFGSNYSDNGGSGRVIMGRNGEGEVTFSNNCVVYYNSHGNRTDKNTNCNSGQGRKADDAMARYRRDHNISSNNYSNEESGDPEAGFAEWQAEQDGNGGIPQVFVGGNGEGEVTFSNNCVVYYDSRGHRKSKNNNCKSGQGSAADNAMAGYRREQGY